MFKYKKKQQHSDGTIRCVSTHICYTENDDRLCIIHFFQALLLFFIVKCIHKFLSYRGLATRFFFLFLSAPCIVLWGGGTLQDGYRNTISCPLT